jgi:RNA polymerase sigma-70 factor (ECF subfamily)
MAALLRLARTVDFDRLYRSHAASVYRYAFAVLGNPADAEDVTQQTFLNAYRAIARGTKPRKPENWLLRIAHNEVRRHFRSTHGRPLEVELDEHLPQKVPERSDPSLADVLRALQHLPPVQRSALVMREFEGRSYAEIAEILNITQSALEGQLFRARRTLAEHLDGALTCVEAEEAVMRRLDGRLPRRVGRRLKEHLRECQVCVRFADVQKRQRAVLKGLSVMPVPASILLFRGEQAAAAGLGASALAAGGSGAVGSGTAVAGAGGTGIAAGFAAKAAAVTAAAVTAGGVGYGAATEPSKLTRAEQTIAAQTAIVPETPWDDRVVRIAATSAPVGRPAAARPQGTRPARKAANTKTKTKTKNQTKTKRTAARPVAPVKAAVAPVKSAARVEKAAAKVARASKQGLPTLKAQSAKRPKSAVPRLRTRAGDKKVGLSRLARPKPAQSERGPESSKQKPSLSPKPPPPPTGPESVSKK